MQYLKPKFQITFLNLAFVLLLGIGSFSWVSLARAGVVYYETMGRTSFSGYDACSSYAGSLGITYYKDLGDYDVCGIGNGAGGTWKDVYVNKYDCDIRYSSICDNPPEPENNCPEYGEPKLVSKLINGKIDGDVFVPTNEQGETVITIGGGAVVDGCSYAVPIGENIPDNFPTYNGKDITCKYNDAQQIMCYKHQYMISTGELGTAGETDAPALTEDSDLKPAEGGSENLIDTEEVKMIGDASTVEEYEGVATTTQTVIETLVKDKGAKVLDSDVNSVVTVSDGIQKTVTTTTTEIEYPDQTKDVITEVNTTYTQTEKTNFIINKDTGVISISSSSPTSASTSKTTTDKYDSEGNLVGSETTSSSSGEGEAEEEMQSDECKENPDSESCKAAEFKKGEGGSFSGASEQLAIVQDEYEELFDNIKEELTDKFDLSLSGGGSMSDDNIEIRGASGNIGITKWLPYFDDFNLAALILFAAAMLSLYIILGGSND